MTRLAYGLIGSQSGAQFCLQQTVANNEVEISKFTRNLASSFYVDDFLTSVSSIHELFTVYDEIRKLMHSGGFHLTKFYTNFQELRASFCRKIVRHLLFSLILTNIVMLSIRRWVCNGTQEQIVFLFLFALRKMLAHVEAFCLPFLKFLILLE